MSKQLSIGLYVLVTFGLGASLPALACPSLGSYYPKNEDRWQDVLLQLESLMPECLENAEYFALYGAAQLNSGMLPPALESLERALLLDPDNGAAQIDYAQALFIAGQLFPALEINQALMRREDLPPNLRDMLQNRQQVWQSQTKNKRIISEFAAGYDNNLNGAPTQSEITLTLSGEPITLTLDPEFRPIEGPFINLRIAGVYQKLAPESTQDWLFSIRNRISENKESDLLQVEGRYLLALPGLGNQWDIAIGSSNLLYGGSPLYSVTEARSRYRLNGDGCRPSYELALQHQFYHEQRFMSGFESSATGGIECRNGNQQIFGIEAGPLANVAIKANRPGDDRKGWKLLLKWQQQLGIGAIYAQFNYTRLFDTQGYSTLLSGGAKRTVYNKLFRFQYSRPLQPGAFFQINLNYQGQDSNIGPFENLGLSLETGISLSF